METATAEMDTETKDIMEIKEDMEARDTVIKDTTVTREDMEIKEDTEEDVELMEMLELEFNQESEDLLEEFSDKKFMNFYD